MFWDHDWLSRPQPNIGTTVGREIQKIDMNVIYRFAFIMIYSTAIQIIYVLLSPHPPFLDLSTMFFLCADAALVCRKIFIGICAKAVTRTGWRWETRTHISTHPLSQCTHRAAIPITAYCIAYMHAFAWGRKWASSIWFTVWESHCDS